MGATPRRRQPDRDACQSTLLRLCVISIPLVFPRFTHRYRLWKRNQSLLCAKPNVDLMIGFCRNDEWHWRITQHVRRKSRAQLLVSNVVLMAVAGGRRALATRHPHWWPFYTTYDLGLHLKNNNKNVISRKKKKKKRILSLVVLLTMSTHLMKTFREKTNKQKKSEEAMTIVRWKIPTVHWASFSCLGNTVVVLTRDWPFGIPIPIYICPVISISILLQDSRNNFNTRRVGRCTKSCRVAVESGSVC